MASEVYGQSIAIGLNGDCPNQTAPTQANTKFAVDSNGNVTRARSVHLLGVDGSAEGAPASGYTKIIYNTNASWQGGVGLYAYYNGAWNKL